MRADVNISVRPVGSKTFGTRTEMKNINSFKAIARCIEGERERQIELLEEKKTIIQETRRWDDNKEYSKAMRSKEDAQDYRYFPDPDLVPIDISDEFLEKIKAAQPEFQEAKSARYKETYGLPDTDIEILTSDKHLADLFEKTVELSEEPKKTANWLIVETQKLLKEKEMDPKDLVFSPKHLASLVLMTVADKVSSGSAKEIFAQMFIDDCDPMTYARDHNLLIVHDDHALMAAVEEAIAQNPQAVEDYRGGKKKAMGALVGYVMKVTHGKADPAEASRLLVEKLKG